MNLPNKLSLLRVILTIALVTLLSIENSFARAMALVVFVIAALTDLVDGYLARKYEIVTDFGKFIDPIADKILVISTLVMLVHLRELHAVVPIIVIFREFAVDGLRLVASTAKKRKTLAAGKLGKVKTIVQIIAIVLYLARPIGVGMLKEIVMVIAVLMTIVSGADYFMKNRNVLNL